MADKTIEKLEADARFEAESWAHAVGRTTTAKRALDDLVREENAAKNKTFEAIRTLATAIAATPGNGKSTEGESK